MSPLVKTKRRANFKDFKRFGALNKKNLVFNSFVSKKKKTIYTTTRQINYYVFLNEASTLFIIFDFIHKIVNTFLPSYLQNS
jgi:uncharacterized membrane protein